METRGWIGVDLDGTLAIYDRWRDIEHIGAPIPAMITRVQRLLRNGQRVKIFTARVSSMLPREDLPRVIRVIEQWCEEHIGQKLEITAEKDFDMIEYYDDRCIRVEYNTGKIL